MPPIPKKFMFMCLRTKLHHSSVMRNSSSPSKGFTARFTSFMHGSQRLLRIFRDSYNISSSMNDAALSLSTWTGTFLKLVTWRRFVIEHSIRSFRSSRMSRTWNHLGTQFFHGNIHVLPRNLVDAPPPSVSSSTLRCFLGSAHRVKVLYMNENFRIRNSEIQCPQRIYDVVLKKIQ